MIEELEEAVYELAGVQIFERKFAWCSNAIEAHWNQSDF
jgi:hypothetical protein